MKSTKNTGVATWLEPTLHTGAGGREPARRVGYWAISALTNTIVIIQKTATVDATCRHSDSH